MERADHEGAGRAANERATRRRQRHTLADRGRHQTNEGRGRDRHRHTLQHDSLSVREVQPRFRRHPSSQHNRLHHRRSCSNGQAFRRPTGHKHHCQKWSLHSTVERARNPDRGAERKQSETTHEHHKWRSRRSRATGADRPAHIDHRRAWRGHGNIGVHRAATHRQPERRAACDAN